MAAFITPVKLEAWDPRRVSEPNSQIDLYKIDMNTLFDWYRRVSRTLVSMQGSNATATIRKYPQIEISSESGEMVKGDTGGVVVMADPEYLINKRAEQKLAKAIADRVTGLAR